MDITMMRKRLALSPQETLSFGAPDRTGWMNVEVTDILSGDFRVVGQLKGDAFRPAGDSLATEPMVPAWRAAPMSESVAERREASRPHEWGSILGTVVAVLGAWAFVEFGLHQYVHAVLVTLALFGAVVGFLGIIELGQPRPTATTAAAPRAPLASDPFNLPTVNCPGCGAPVSTDICPHCGWVRPLT